MVHLLVEVISWTSRPEQEHARCNIDAIRWDMDQAAYMWTVPKIVD